MRLIQIAELSEDLSSVELVEAAQPKPAKAEALIRMKAVSINYPDVLMVKGGYQFKPPLPFSPGMEGAGIVEAVGKDVTNIAIGDEVMVGGRAGLLAEYITCPADSLRPKPKALTFAEAAGLTTIYLTAYVALVRRSHLQPSETLLVHGAAGGVGIAAVELGKHMGATVIATASTAEKRALAKSKGADHVLDPADGFRERVKELTDGRGADVIYDPVGGAIFDESVRCIAWEGRLLVIGFAGGTIPTISANMPLIKGFSVIGVRAGEYGRRDPAKGAENIAAVMKLAEQGAIKPPIRASFPLEQARDALLTLDNRAALGKVVVEL
ncbi:MAG: NADPH:quinone oxidoreductase family protein [Alphaproteobacteria bacterium]